MNSSPSPSSTNTCTTSPLSLSRKVMDLGLDPAGLQMFRCARRMGLAQRLNRLVAARRCLASQARLIDFTCATWPGYRPAPHHYLIADALGAVERGENDRLMIFMPPRHGKSELASCRFPAWYLGRNPERQVIAASHSVRLATGFGRQVRNLMGSEEYAGIFPGVGLSQDSRAAHRLNTPQGGIYVAAGVGTGITGLGADLLLIDDPIRGRGEADSERRRQAVDAWYRSDAFTRLMSAGAIVLIQTRWHEDDLAGRLLERRPSEWTVLDLPAISAEGSALWPERYGLPKLDRIKEELGPRAWSALYQQRPQPEEGSFFRRDDLVEWKVLPEKLHVYGTSDYAVTDGGGDYTVHQVWGIDVDGILYRVDGWRGQTGPDEWVQRKLNLIAKWRPLAWFGEAGTIEKSIEPLLTLRMNERKIWCKMVWLPSIQDKPTRARGFQALVSAGRVRFEPGADLAEYLAFHTGRRDDEVDASSLIGRALDMVHPAIVGVDGKPAPRKDRWDRAFDEDEPRGTWMSA